MSVKYKRNGKPISEQEFHHIAPLSEPGIPQCARSGAKWPVVSDYLGVHPRQVKKVKEHLDSHDCHTDFAPDGRPIIRSASHMTKVAELTGVYERIRRENTFDPGEYD